MRLQEKLNQMKKESLAAMPPEIARTIAEETEKLVKSGIADNALKTGDTLPYFSLENEKGEVINRDELLAKGPVVVSFYRGAW